MTSSGVGRGRGWLNLSKEARNRPGNPISPQENSNDLQWSKTMTSHTPSAQQYTNLISLISQISSNDDGILLNQKLKAIIELWERDCSTSNEVVESFQYIYNKCLEDETLVSKVVIMISSYTFMTTPISGEYLRPLFIRHMQNTYDNFLPPDGKQIQSGNPTKFRNAVKLLGEYFNKAKLINGRPINVLVPPLLCYFEMLLESAQPADLELFATQLYLTGSLIKNTDQQQLNDLMNKVRKILISNGELTKTSKLYLLLAIEIATNRFSLLPADVHSFYQEQLGEQVMAQFQGALGALSIQTQQSNKTLDGYQSTVNVLQVSPPEPSSPINDQLQQTQQQQIQQQVQQTQKSHLVQQQQQKVQSSALTSATNTHSKQTTQTYSSNNYNSNEISASFGNWEDKKEKPNNNRNEKAGRPILGSGARLKKDKNDGTANWRDSNKEGGQWGDKSGSFWREKKPSAPKSYGKGWEHDDRFSTDYN